MTIFDQLYPEVLADAQFKKPCILCGSITHSRGVFVPYNRAIAKKFSGKKTPDDKTQVVMYPLCEDHEKDVTTFDLVELMLFSDIYTRR